MKAITVSLKGIYKASQCSDLNDVNFALSTLKEIARSCYNNEYTPAMRRRLTALTRKAKNLSK